jgi:hypothetical protein
VKSSILARIAADFTDRSASKRTDFSWDSGVWTTAGVLLTAAAGYFESAEKLFAGAVGDFKGSFRLLLVVVVALLGCVFMVRSKRQVSTVILMKTSDEDEPAIWSAFAEMPHHR